MSEKSESANANTVDVFLRKIGENACADVYKRAGNKKLGERSKIARNSKV